ncbi:MAG: polymer-forming cytoskeletal protein, partial [Bacteroidota bacterium]
MATKTSTSSSSTYGDSGMNCVIAPGTKIEGDFTTSENVRIDGSVVGHIKCDRKLVLGKNASIEGTLAASEAVLMGTVIGNVTIGGLLKLKRLRGR